MVRCSNVEERCRLVELGPLDDEAELLFAFTQRFLRLPSGRRVEHELHDLVTNLMATNGSASSRARDAVARRLTCQPILLEDGEHGCRTTEIKHAAAGGDMLVVAGARTEVVAEFIVAATEALG
jgi:hypothetical protein